MRHKLITTIHYFVSIAFSICTAVLVSCNKEPQDISVAGITLNKSALSMIEGDEFNLIPTITPQNATDKSIRWSSDNEATAIVSSEGTVTALSAGSATITVTTINQGLSATCSIEVINGVSVVSGKASHISCRSAKISGKVNLQKNKVNNLVFGILYSTSSDLIPESAIQVNANSFDSEYNFVIDTGILEPETTYYYRSYASYNSNVVYGDVNSFKTLAVSSMIQTSEAFQINPKDAILNAALDLSNCQVNEVEYGFEITPQGDTPYIIKATNHDGKSFSVKAESLMINTEYAYAAYVTLDGRTYRGNEIHFTSATLDVSVSTGISDISHHSATISGNLTVDSEGSFRKSAALYFGKDLNTIDALKTQGTKNTLELSSDGSYTIDLSSLFSNTSYNFVVIATVDDSEFMSDVKSFKTLEIKASVSAESSKVAYHTATISGKLMVNSEGSFRKTVALYYGEDLNTIDALKSQGTKNTLEPSTDGSYTIDLSSLSSNTNYNFVVIATVDDSEFMSDVKSFKTLEIKASVSTESSNISYYAATISGNLTIESYDSFSKSATLYYSTNSNTLEDLKTQGTIELLTISSDGSFTITLSELNRGTLYNYLIVCQVDDAEFDTDVHSFTTTAPYCPSGAVDLGLSVFWATYNLGALSPEEYGDYYAFGQVIPYPEVKNMNTDVIYYGLTTYSGDSFFDAATKIKGSQWRTPTKEEALELISKCKWTYTTRNSINGYEVSGSNGNTIFIPCAGHITTDKGVSKSNGEGAMLQVMTSTRRKYQGLYIMAAPNWELGVSLFELASTICIPIRPVMDF